MTISTSASKIVALGNGVTVSFSFSFLIPQSGEEQVIFTDALGNQTVLSNTLYALIGFGNPAGGTVTYPLSGSPIPTGTSLTIARVLPLVQGTTISNQGAFYPQVVEGALDYEMMVSQQLNQTLKQAILAPIVDQNPMGQLPAATQRAGKYLAFDSNGNPIATGAASTINSLTLNGATSGTLVVAPQPVASGTLNFPNGNDTLIARASTDTITGPKTFNPNTLILAGATSGTTLLNATAIASGTLTLPAATDTLVARNTTDTLSNKTFSDQPSVRLNLTVPVYVTSLAALQALDTTKDIVACVTGSGAQTFYNWTAGNFSTQITAADPRYVASNANPTGSSGAWIQRGSVETGQFFQPSGAMVHYLADRVLMGSAVANKASAVASQPDWLTTFQIARGRTTGFIEFAQSAVLTSSNSNSANALVAAAETSSLAGLGNSIGAILVGVNNNSSFTNGAFGGYAEAYRMSGALGGCTGWEIDTINYASLAAINPFAQSSAQTIGLQMAPGGALSAVGQFPGSAGINFWNNNATWNTGINFGSTAINGTNGTDGNTGEAIAMATGHAINYYYGNATKSWTLNANIGVNGNYAFTSAGTGAVAVPKLFAGSGLATPNAAITLSNNAAALPTPVSATVMQIGGVDGASTRLALECFGAGVTAGIVTRAARNTAASPQALQSGDQIMNMGAFGYGATAYSSTGRATIVATAEEAWSDTAQGSAFSFYVTPTTTAAQVQTMKLNNNGMLGLIAGSLSRNAPVTKTANFTLGTAENWIICNGTATITATLPGASTFSGREVTFRTIAGFTVVSASSNVVPLAGGAASTAILPATAGKWATLVSDGTNWQIMASN